MGSVINVSASGGGGGGGSLPDPVTVAHGGTGATSASNARTNLGLAIGTDVQTFDADLSAVAGLSSSGIIARTGAGTASARTITGTSNRITVTNGDGVSGNPTLDVGSTVYTSGGTDVAIADGGTGASTAAGGFDALSPTTTRGDLIARGASSNGRVAIGTKGRFLVSDGTDPQWLTLLHYRKNQMGFFSASSGSALGGFGSLGSFVNTGTITLVTTADGACHNAATAATTGADAGALGQPNHRPFQYLYRSTFKFQLQTTATVRTFLGFSSSTSLNTNLANDDVTASMIGLQYSTNRADTNFQFMRDDGATQTLIDTGVAVDTSAHYFVMDCTATNSITYELWDATYTTLQATATVTTVLPASATVMVFMYGCETLANSAAAKRIFFGAIDSRHV